MFKKILCPIDFSNHAHEALKMAVLMAEKYEAELSVIHIVDPVPVGMPQAGVAPVNPKVFNISNYEKNMQKVAKEQLDDICQKEISSTVHYDQSISVGHAGEAITEFAEEKGVDLIVLSTHGRTGLKRLLLGSTAEYVIRHASKPVLTVRISE